MDGIGDAGSLTGHRLAVPFHTGRIGRVTTHRGYQLAGVAVALSEIGRVLKSNGPSDVNSLPMDGRESWQPFCETSPAMELLRSERFAHYEDDEADMYFNAFDILRRVKRLVDKAYEGKRLQQADIKYIARKR